MPDHRGAAAGDHRRDPADRRVRCLRWSKTAPPRGRHRPHPPGAARLPQGQEGPGHPHRDDHRRHHRSDRVRAWSPAARKTVDRGKVVASFCLGTRSSTITSTTTPFSFHPTEYVNDPNIISQQHKMVAVNTALEIDLTGQVCADSHRRQVLLRRRRAGGFQPRRGQAAGRQGHHRAALDRAGRRGFPHRHPPQPGRGRRHHAGACTTS
jgi:hypothetical protein